MVKSYKLSYFDVYGLGEMSRLLFATSGQQFEDDRIPFSFKDGNYERPTWAAQKSSRVYEKVPELLIDGKTVISQSRAIERYIAREFGLHGNDNIQAALIDSVVEEIRDLLQDYMTSKSDETKKSEFFQTKLPHYFALLERQAKTNGWTSNVANTGKVNYADLYLYQLITHFFDDKQAVQNALKSAPHLEKISQTVANDPKVSEYIKNRPKCPF